MKVRISTLVILLLLLGITLSGVKEFSAWPQVVDLWLQRATPATLTGHPHLFRYMVAYPGLMLERDYPGLGFSLYCCLFMLLNASVWSAIVRKTHQVSPSYVIWGLFFLVHMFMNGRGVIAWSAWLLGVSLCIDMSRAQVPIKWPVLRGAVACFLGTVSTGVFVIVLFAIFLFFLERWKAGGVKLRNFSGLVALILLMLCGYVFLSYFIVAIEKNLDFYGGGIQGLMLMLKHGMGKIFFADGGLGLILLLLALPIGALGALIFFFGPRIRPVRKLLIISMAGGLFGFTVLTLAIPLLLCEAGSAMRRVLRFLGLQRQPFAPVVGARGLNVTD
ncbi:hypothetical protein DN387_03440 [Pseudomonas sp. FBF18]|uniref:hypothetical protein n=1 Tax=Pseudomonas TaxID=286 RepID=UPI0006D3C6C6|nr:MULTISPECIES: hypothetical protein [Pseudomonas]MCP8347297.1 hypothetical protein [Pseudomonas sp. FBF18]